MLTDKKSSDPTKKELSYIAKVWHTVAIVALLVVFILIARVAFNVLLMALAGSLIAVYFHGLGDLIERKTRLSRKFAMIISVAGTIVLFGALVWFIGAKIQSQIAQLSSTLPHTINTAKARLDQTLAGQKLIEYSSGDNSKTLLDTAQAFFSTSFGVLGNMYIILFLGIFFTASPSLYKNGILAVVPANKKPVTTYIMDRISLSLRGWLKGMLLSMVLITILITLGLTIIGVPVALVLGLITGILEIIPNIGPLIAMIPGVLLGFTISTGTAVIVAIVYIISQTIVVNIVTPVIQKKMINLPPALTLISQLIMGTLSGALGILLAVPMLAILIILVDELYVKKINTISGD
ncbi:MAG TPA: AI-2E family transporter [Mucilaginibacter sp.]